MESYFRQKLADLPAAKLFLKIFIDLLKGDVYQFKNSLGGWLLTIECHFDRLTGNQHLVECNICRWQGNRFYPHVTKSKPVPDEKCPACHSIPRYRLLQYFLVHDLDFYEQKLSVLEVGPNRSLQKILRTNTNFNYISIDLQSPQAMIHMDVTDLKFEDHYFDFIFCISVMQFVENDLQGFREMYRVLKPGGRLLFASGLDDRMQKTITYPSPSASQSYARRVYGRDVIALMKQAGFTIKKYYPARDIKESVKKRYGINDEVIYLLTRES